MSIILDKVLNVGQALGLMTGAGMRSPNDPRATLSLISLAKARTSSVLRSICKVMNPIDKLRSPSRPVGPLLLHEFIVLREVAVKMSL